MDKSGQYNNKQVSFVKVNPHSKLDFNSVVDVGDLWDEANHNYVKSMLNHSSIIKDAEVRNVYILTEQEGNYRKVVPKKVLGMIEITSRNDYDEINFIQTHPNLVYGKKSRKYKGIGLAMLDLANELSEGKKIVLNAVRNAVSFYEKYGFKKITAKCLNPKMLLEKRIPTKTLL